MSERNKSITTVEEAIQILAYNEHLWDGFSPHGKDRTTVNSLAEAPYAYTEKQGKLAVALLKRYHTLFQKFNLDLTHLINNPVYKEPFRVIDYAKSMERYIENDKEWIEMKFPYNLKIINLIRALKSKSDRMIPAIYHGEQKRWQIACTELTLYYCTLIAVRYDFKIVNPEILDDFEDVKKEKLSYQPPRAKLTNGGLTMENAPESLTEWWNNNYADKSFLHQCDVLKELEIENNINFATTENSTLADKIATWKHREMFVDRNKWTKTQFLGALQELDSLPALVTTGNEFSHYRDIEELYNWYQAMKAIGFDSEQVAWGYTIDDVPDWRKSHQSDEDKFFHGDPYPKEFPEDKREKLYDRWQEMRLASKANKHVDENTKIVFVKTRLPRTLIKSKIKLKSTFTMFDTAYWPTGTETMGRVVDNLPKRIYYITRSKTWPSNKKHEFL